jgi:hypothetical protein
MLSPAQGKSLPYECFCHKFSSSSHVSETPSLKSPSEYVAQRIMYPSLKLDRTWQWERPSLSQPRQNNAMSKSSDTFVSDQIFLLSLSPGSVNAASWSADQRRKALCPTKGVTSPFCACYEGTLLDTAGKVRNRNSDERPA